MKQLLLFLIIAVFASSPVIAAEPTKKTTSQKKEVKKHKKVEGSKVPDNKPKAPAKKEVDKKK